MLCFSSLAAICQLWTNHARPTLLAVWVSELQRVRLRLAVFLLLSVAAAALIQLRIGHVWRSRNESRRRSQRQRRRWRQEWNVIEDRHDNATENDEEEEATCCILLLRQHQHYRFALGKGGRKRGMQSVTMTESSSRSKAHTEPTKPIASPLKISITCWMI